MSSMCYPDVLQAVVDDYCSKAGLERIMEDRPASADPSLPSLRRAVIARLSYCVKVMA